MHTWQIITLVVLCLLFVSAFAYSIWELVKADVKQQRLNHTLNNLGGHS
jgi:uncharacterized membrane protein YqjE